jgi:hypothetical protein
VPVCAVDRADAPSLIRALLEDPDATVVLVTGAPGCGKTSACQAALAAGEAEGTLVLKKWDLMAPLAPIAAACGGAGSRLDRFFCAGAAGKGKVVFFADDADVVVHLQGSQGSAALAAALGALGRSGIRVLMASSGPEVLAGGSKAARDIAACVKTCVEVVAPRRHNDEEEEDDGGSGDPFFRMDVLLLEAAAEWDASNEEPLAAVAAAMSSEDKRRRRMAKKKAGGGDAIVNAEAQGLPG